MGRAKLTVPMHQLEMFCRRHHIRKLALFGSVLRDDFGPDSDVDALVEFEPGHVPGLAFFDRHGSGVVTPHRTASRPQYPAVSQSVFPGYRPGEG
jgi:hypothetical protein